MFGRRDLSPSSVYYALRGGYTFFFVLAVSVNLIFQTQEAGLNPLQLVLVGTLQEATIFFLEIPTGIVADIYSRRLSVVLGFALIGVGLIINAAWPIFATILAGQVVWGIGHTFMSGAHQAWIADEIGAENAGPVYLRSSQIEQVARLIATPVAVVIATQGLNLPVLIGGAAFILMAPIALAIMPERGFRRPAPGQRKTALESMKGTLVQSSQLVRRSPLLLTIFAIAAFYGMASEGFDRLWVAHFYTNLGFPGFLDLKPVIWLGVARTGWVLLSIVAVGVVIKRVNTTSNFHVSRTLLLINAVQVVSLFVFAGANGFTVGMLATWGAVCMSASYEPLFLAWINQSVDSSVRATVLSMRSQADAIGQIAGGPALGVIGTIASLRAALFGAGLTLLPALALYLRAIKLGEAPKRGGPADAG